MVLVLLSVEACSAAVPTVFPSTLEVTCAQPTTADVMGCQIPQGEIPATTGVDTTTLPYPDIQCGEVTGSLTMIVKRLRRDTEMLVSRLMCNSSTHEALAF